MAECTGLPASASQCVWNNPGPVSEQAHVRVTATDTSNATGSGDSGRFSIRSSGGGGVPEGWNQQDIGAVAAAGSATYNNGVFTVKGSGADIWGTADEFHYVYRTLNGAASGPVDLTTRVDSVQNVNAWTKAGLMVRSTLDAGSPHVSIFITPGKGVAFQRRTSAGAVSVNTSGAAITAPVWLRLTVNGGQVRGFYKKNATDLWTELGITQFPDWVDTYGGLAVTSHADGTLATAAFSNVTVAPPPSPLARGLVGGATGTVSSDSVLRNYTLTDRGTDIWGTADQFTFAYQSWSGDGRVEAMIPGMTNTNVWTKAGVMFRSTLSAGSPHVSLFVTPSTKGIAMQYRPTANAASVQVAQIPRTASRVFLRLTRSGNTFTGAWSEDWSTWHTIGTISVAIAPNALAGIVLTSHDASATASAAFADPSVSR
jgi:regulation of enolase protein 1 (concanavalin A-like superfamily)